MRERIPGKRELGMGDPSLPSAQGCDRDWESASLFIASRIS